ncbi:plasma-membrane proton-efflux P-type ATPase [Sorangium sp. So ce448]|uniref:plasma-membrane proton-efflux P-type ATPase n=1 Tax=Sorangium sp. So ce448 TaxID=3133314 RepID=UPI003F5E4254
MRALDDASLDDALSELRSDARRGLSADEAKRRLEEYGPNVIEEEKKRPLLKLLSYFWGPIPWMLEAASVLSGIGARWEELCIVLVMLLVNGGVGWWHESRAAEAIEALKNTLAPRARALRGGERRTIDARELVPGDILVLRRGDVVPADGKLVGDELSIDESALTGESLPVDKRPGDAVYTGTAVKSGEARALVLGTGRNTRFGRTVELVAGVQERSHFQKAVLRIGYFLMAATAVLVLTVVSIELMRAQGWMDVLLFALILTVAGIPVALPAVLSVTMAVGARRLAAQKAIVSRLAAMEELAGVEILLSDKTGTLTLNQLELQEPVVVEARDRDELVLAAALASDRSEERDPIDAAILAAVDVQRLAPFEIRSFRPFDSTRKYAGAQVTRGGDSFRVAKGAPQVLLRLCEAKEPLRDAVRSEVDRLGAAGFRALGVARQDGGTWRYLGLLSLLDPPREDSARVVEDAKAHGVDVRLLTGDHQAIARQVASRVGLGQNIVEAGDWLRSDDPRQVERAMSADGFSEVTPEDKYNIVERFQREGQIVAMTGDGVNDAPALKKADVGLAVSSATDAARAASDIVLTEPGLGVIIGAIEEARRIFERMRSYATFRIAETTRMVLFVAGTIVLLGIYPVTAIMVALLAILNDIPIMTIAMDNTRSSAEPVRWNMRWVLADASLLGLTGVLASSLLLWFALSYLRLPVEELQTVLFLKLLVAGHMTVYVTRVRDWFWRRPWPSWKLLVALESTQILGTLVAIFGWLVAPIPWWLALGLWGYAIVWMFLLSGVRVLVLRKLGPRLSARHAERAGADRAERERADSEPVASGRSPDAAGDAAGRAARPDPSRARLPGNHPPGPQRPSEQR